MKREQIEKIEITSPAFVDQGAIPVQYTGFGADISPGLVLSQVHEAAVSLAVIMNDLDIPLMKEYNHWTVWNLPVGPEILENIPYGPEVKALGEARQGVGYGKHRYRGPKPPAFIKKPHRYEFHVYVLDCRLDLPADSGKRELLQAMDGHVLQQGSITGIWSNRYTKE